MAGGCEGRPTLLAQVRALAGVFTHVNGQVACGSVRMPAHPTDVGFVHDPLRVLAPLVGLEVTDACELRLTLAAAQCRVCVTLPQVKGQPIRFGKSSLTLSALEVSGCAVSGGDVVSQGESPGEARTTFLAAVTFVGHVGGHVTGETTLEDKLGPTDGASVFAAPLLAAVSLQP